MLNFSSQAALISTAVGRVQDHVVTSREIGIQLFVEQVLRSSKKAVKIENLPSLESRQFTEKVSDKLLERAIFIESQSFSVAQVSEASVNEGVNDVIKKLKNQSQWIAFDVTRSEIQLAVRQYLGATKFIRFKADSSAVPVTDIEALRHFEANRSRFGALPFENFRENIKFFLTRQQSEERLKEWYEVLKSKYRVRNFLIEM